MAGDSTFVNLIIRHVIDATVATSSINIPSTDYRRGITSIRENLTFKTRICDAD